MPYPAEPAPMNPTVPLRAPNPFMRLQMPQNVQQQTPSQVTVDSMSVDAVPQPGTPQAAAPQSASPKGFPRITARFPAPQTKRASAANQKYDPLDTAYSEPALRRDAPAQTTATQTPPVQMPSAQAPSPYTLPASAPQAVQPHAFQQQTQQPAVPQSPAVQPDAPQLSPVERFRQLNKSLPDGVQYEPLDPETLRLLRESVQPPQAQPAQSQTAQPHSAQSQSSQANPAQTQPMQQQTAQHPSASPAQPMWQPPSPMPVFKRNETIEQFIQDERNSRVFYASLAENAAYADAKKILTNISESCGERMKVLSAVYKRLHRQEFEPKETEINTSVGLTEGLSLAVMEESKSILALSEWLDKNPDNETARVVQNLINKKSAAINMLTLIKS